LVGKPDGKRPLGRSRYRWEVDIILNLREVGLDGTAWIHLVQSREVCCEHGNEPSGSIKYWEILE
jgi:hypothetical protein